MEWAESYPLLDYIKNKKEFWLRLAMVLKKLVPVDKTKAWQVYEENFFLFPQMQSLIRKLKEKGLKIAVLFNTIPPHIEIIKKHDKPDRYDCIVFSFEAGARKPDNCIFLKG